MLTIHTEAQSTRLSLVQVKTRLGDIGYRQSTRLTIPEYDAVLEYMRGEKEGSTLQVLHAVDKMTTRFNLLGRYAERGPCSLPASLLGAVWLTNPSFVTLRSNDGGETRLRRSRTGHFTLLRDYFEDYPEENSIELPYSTEVVRAALGPLHSKVVSLVSCRECVKHLNPTCNTYYLEFNLEGIEPDELKLLAHSFTEKERKELRVIYGTANYSYPLPGDGEGHGILASCETVRCYSRINELFSSYPSWLFCHLAYGWHGDEVYYTALLEGDFRGEQCETYSGDLHTTLKSYITQALKYKKDLTWDQAAHLLAMLGLSGSFLFNESLDVCPPYGIVLITKPFEDEDVKKRMRSIYPGVWSDTEWSYLCRTSER